MILAFALILISFMVKAMGLMETRFNTHLFHGRAMRLMETLCILIISHFRKKSILFCFFISKVFGDS